MIEINKFITPSIITIILVCLIFIPGCTEKMDKFDMKDFGSIEKIDIHTHINTLNFTFAEQVIADNFRIITINTDVPYYPPIEEQQQIALHQCQNHPDNIAYSTTFSLTGWDDPDWHEKTIAYLEDSFEKGAIAVKVWKNIGMEFKDKDGNFIMIDHPRFDPIFTLLSKKGIPVIGHIGEPRNCWLPLEEMTVNNDREYFEGHPEYHMYLHPEFLSYEDHVNARDRMLEKNPDLKFIGAHLGTLEWSVDELANRFEKFPNFAVDFAARMSHIQFQSSQDKEKIREFFITYQDHLIYGTDLYAEGTEDPVELKKKMHDTWLKDWKYLATDAAMTTPEVNGEFTGLSLPHEVIEKIYSKNALKWFKGLN